MRLLHHFQCTRWWDREVHIEMCVVRSETRIEMHLRVMGTYLTAKSHLMGNLIDVGIHWKEPFGNNGFCKSIRMGNNGSARFTAISYSSLGCLCKDFKVCFATSFLRYVGEYWIDWKDHCRKSRSYYMKSPIFKKLTKNCCLNSKNKYV